MPSRGSTHGGSQPLAAVINALGHAHLHCNMRPVSPLLTHSLPCTALHALPVALACRYDPVFQVKTIDGRTVWRRRHYRVKRDRLPGTFRFSVLDNGVTSSEFWRILDCDERLDW